MLMSPIKVATFADSANPIGNGHHARELGGTKRLRPYFAKGGHLPRSIGSAIDSLDQVGRPVFAVVRKRGESINAVITFVPEVGGSMERKHVHDQILREIDTQSYGEEEPASFAQLSVSGQLLVRGELSVTGEVA